MSLIFKEFRGAQKAYEISCCWISQQGHRAIVGMNLKNTGQVADYSFDADLIQALETSEHQESVHWLSFSAELLGSKFDSFATLCVEDGRAYWRMKGKCSLIGIEDRRPEVINNASGSKDLRPGEYFLLTLGEINASKLKKLAPRIEQETSTKVEESLQEIAGEAAWHSIIFPMESTLSFENPDWPENPFVGFQESGNHEKLGLRLLADALFDDGSFAGFRIVGGHHFVSAFGSRLLDGILLCPWGVFLIELKHHRGVIHLEVQNRNSGMRIQNSGPERFETNPVFKIEEALREGLKDLDVGISLNHKLKGFGLLVFTNPNVRVNCVLPDSSVKSIPHNCGKVIVATPETIAQQLKHFVQSLIAKDTAIPKGSHGAAPISRHQILQMAERLSGKYIGHLSANSEKPREKQIGRFVIQMEAILSESTADFETFPAKIEGKPMSLWVKRYDLTSMMKSMTLEEEIGRVGREISALQDLAGIQGVPRYRHHALEDLSLYVFLDRTEGQTLDSWLSSEPRTIQSRISVLMSLAEILAHLHNENIVHRAVRPFNIRITEDDKVALINFDLCQVSTSLTIDSATRLRLDAAFLSREALSPGARLSARDDVFSFGKIACLVLCGKLPFESPTEHMHYFAKPVRWNEYIRQADLPEMIAIGLRKLLELNPQLRPVGRELVEMVELWKI